MERMAQIIRLKDGTLDEYTRLHADVWPTVLKQIADSNIRNYSIFLKEPENILFAYFEYHGTDYAADMARMAADPETQRWWKICDPMQEPFETRKDGEWWARVEEVFYTA